MSQFNVSKNENSPDQIYFDITSTNFESVSKPPKPFYYNEARELPFIEKPEDYYLSIMRFTTETQNLPVFIPSIKPQQDGNVNSDANLTIYSVTLQIADRSDPMNVKYGSAYQVPIYWRPQNQSAPIPTSLGENGQQNNSTGYYNCDSYEYFILLIQEALNTAFVGISVDAKCPANTLPPQLCWDSTTNKAYFVVDTRAYCETYSDSLFETVPDLVQTPLLQQAVNSDNARTTFVNQFNAKISPLSVASTVNNFITNKIPSSLKSLGGAITSIGAAPIMTQPIQGSQPILSGQQIINQLDGLGGNLTEGTYNNFPIPVHGTNPAGGFNPPTVVYSSYSTTKIDVYFNTPLFNLFNSFPSYSNGYNSQLSSFGRHRRILFANRNGINEQRYTTSRNSAASNPSFSKSLVIPEYYTGLQVYQESSTIYNLSPITSLVFCSNTLPINPNLVSTPLIYNNNRQIQFKGANSAIANIITDLTADDGQYRPYLVYLPQAQYRLISLHGNRPLYNLDLSIFYRTKYGELIPFQLASGSTMTIKMAFLKKTSTQGT